MTENLPAKLTDIERLLAKNMEVIEKSIPKHMTPERMLRIAFTTIQNTPGLADCTMYSLVAAVVEASQLGLEIDGRGLAYLVPFKDRAQLIVGYKGKVQLFYQTNMGKDIYAEVVYENDEFAYERGLNPILYHKPKFGGDRGKMIGVYCVAELVNGGKPFAVLTAKDIEKIKKVSQASSSSYSPWSKWEDEMWKKSAVHRLSKMIPSSPEMQRAVMLEDQMRGGVSQTMADNLPQGVKLLGVTPDTPQSATDQNAADLRERVKKQQEDAQKPTRAEEQSSPLEEEPEAGPPPGRKSPTFTVTDEQKAEILDLCEKTGLTVTDILGSIVKKQIVGKLQFEEADKVIAYLKGQLSPEEKPSEEIPLLDQKPETETADSVEDTMPEATTKPWPDWTIKDKESLLQKADIKAGQVRRYLAETQNIVEDQGIYNFLQMFKDQEKHQEEFIASVKEWLSENM